MILWLDLETYSDIPIANGVYKYAEKCEILLFSWAINDDPVFVVDVASGEQLPDKLRAALFNPAVTLCAHNSNFDRTILRKVYGDVVGNPDRWIDTMILALSVGLPGSLAELCSVLQIPQDKAKDKIGKIGIGLFSSPHWLKGEKVRYTRATHPVQWADFVRYANKDVVAMREIYRRVCRVNDKPEIWAEFHLDQQINDRGMAIDRRLVTAVLACCSSAKEDIDARIAELTGGLITSIGQRAEILKFIKERFGYSLPDLQKSTLERRVNDPDTPPEIRDILLNRLLGSKASVAKYTVLQNATGADGRLRGCLQFMGASRTGRFSGRLFQPQNLPRGTLSPAEVEEAIGVLKSGGADLVYDDINAVASSCLRGCIVAPKGRRLVVADLSNIEGRVLAWLAHETWKLQAFRDCDEGRGADIYKLTYSRTFGVEVADVNKKRRQVGKVLELGLGYGGGAMAFLNYAQVYNLDLSEVVNHVFGSFPKAEIERSTDTWEFFKSRGQVDVSMRRTFIAIDAVKNAWRRANPQIVKLWGSLASGLSTLVGGSAKAARVGDLCAMMRGRMLLVRLPSGRYIGYPAATATGNGTFKYFAVNQSTRRAGFVDTYGGKLTENITQAVARDVLVSSMPVAEALGYEIVLSVHDELITEAPDSPEYTAAELSQIMSTAPAWASDLPLNAAGFEAYRYKKD